MCREVESSRGACRTVWNASVRVVLTLKSRMVRHLFELPTMT